MVKKTYNLDELKSASNDLLKNKKIPTIRDEKWRYSDLDILQSAESNKSLDAKSVVELDHAKYSIVICDGKVDDEASTLPKEYLDYTEQSEYNFDFGDGKFDSQYQVLQNYSDLKNVIQFDFQKSPNKPVEVIYSSTKAHNLFVLFSIRSGLKLSLHETFASTNNTYFNHVTKINLCEDTSLKHFKSHDFIDETKFLYSLQLETSNNAIYNNFFVNYGIKSYRQYVNCLMYGANSIAHFYGVSIGKESEIYDVIFDIKHIDSHSSSLQYYNHVFDDSSKGSFYSKIYIPNQLHNINTQQFNQNLLLSKDAQAFSRPELDIYSEDVKCSHGSTIGYINEDEIYYMKSRGLDENVGKNLLIRGFLKKVFDQDELDDEEKHLIQSNIVKIL
ncbi:MAG: Fe-S cluster assembly protein SufD [Candidatus Midichloriaceae bacterium]|jgi:Fe-S cluster assembly protein SufD